MSRKNIYSKKVSGISACFLAPSFVVIFTICLIWNLYIYVVMHTFTNTHIYELTHTHCYLTFKFNCLPMYLPVYQSISQSISVYLSTFLPTRRHADMCALHLISNHTNSLKWSKKYQQQRNIKSWRFEWDYSPPHTIKPIFVVVVVVLFPLLFGFVTWWWEYRDSKRYYLILL